MEIALDQKTAKKECSQQYDKIVADMKKKGVLEKDLSFSYYFGIRIDNDQPDMSSEANYIRTRGSKFGVSLKAKNGRKLAVEGLDFTPDTIVQNLKAEYIERVKKESTENNKITNLDGILAKVGKTGSCKITAPNAPAVMNGMAFIAHMKTQFTATRPVFPTIEDLKSAEPQVYQKYLAQADGTKLVQFAPEHENCDEWGFLVGEVACGYKPIKKEDQRIRILFHENGETFNECALFDEAINNTNSNLELWIYANGSEKAFAAKEGTEFKGWKGAASYRLTSTELAKIVSGRIFMLHLDIGHTVSSSGLMAFGI